MTDLVNKVCPECGSSALFTEGIITWDISLQLWVSERPERNSKLWCMECNDYTQKGHQRPLNIKEIAQVAIKKQEKLNETI